MGHLAILLGPCPRPAAAPSREFRAEYGRSIFRLYVKSMCSVGYLGNRVGRRGNGKWLRRRQRRRRRAAERQINCGGGDCAVGAFVGG